MKRYIIMKAEEEKYTLIDVTENAEEARRIASQNKGPHIILIIPYETREVEIY